jgi:hypothetical protein
MVPATVFNSEGLFGIRPSEHDGQGVEGESPADGVGAFYQSAVAAVVAGPLVEAAKI